MALRKTMSLDLSSTATQIDGMAHQLKARQGDRERRLQNALSAVADFPVDSYGATREQAGERWNTPLVLEPPASRYAAEPPPPDFRVAATDGSHIEVDRHLAVRCFLINAGISVLTYGARPDADLFSMPRLYAGEDELVMREEGTNREQTIEGAVLGAKRAVEETAALAELVEALTPDTPTLALMDGSLVMLGLVGHGYHDFVLRELIEDGFVAALERLRLTAKGRPLAVASYISLPGHAELVSALRTMTCAYGDAEEERRCGIRGPGASPCDVCVGGVLDREIFARLLEPGERSAVFSTSSRVVDNHYKGTGVSFFYVNVGEEIGRVEVPSWIADDEATLGMAHSLVVDQCRRGRGYPVALMEAHEQAVIGTADRRYFVQLVEQALHQQGTPVYTSEKARSKRLRWL